MTTLCSVILFRCTKLSVNSDLPIHLCISVEASVEEVMQYKNIHQNLLVAKNQIGLNKKINSLDH